MRLRQISCFGRFLELRFSFFWRRGLNSAWSYARQGFFCDGAANMVFFNFILPWVGWPLCQWLCQPVQFLVWAAYIIFAWRSEIFLLFQKQKIQKIYTFLELKNYNFLNFYFCLGFFGFFSAYSGPSTSICASSDASVEKNSPQPRITINPPPEPKSHDHTNFYLVNHENQN